MTKEDRLAMMKIRFQKIEDKLNPCASVASDAILPVSRGEVGEEITSFESFHEHRRDILTSDEQ